VENVLVLDYGEPESLEILKARADEFAAIMVEPVQSRRPDLQPREFLHQVQAIANRSGAAFIMDEVITGFRIHPGGAQAHFGLEADLGTYGKIVGGGLPIGVIAGKRKFMDALDGGFWQFGDDSFPEVGVTYFAGTFVRHPLSMAAAKVVLQRLKQEGPDLQRSLNQKADYLAATLNTLFQQHQAPFTIANFGSLFKLNYASDFPHGELLYYWLRHHGLHIWDHRPCFLTLAHTNEDIAFIINAFKQSWMDMRAAGFLPELVETSSTNNGIHYHNGHGNGHGNGKAATCWSANKPPMPGARLGRDLQGNPAWFVPDPDRPGKFLQVI
jgi:glutamate-1-semialdehyde aminotransferase